MLEKKVRKPCVNTMESCCAMLFNGSTQTRGLEFSTISRKISFHIVVPFDLAENTYKDIFLQCVVSMKPEIWILIVSSDYFGKLAGRHPASFVYEWCCKGGNARILSRGLSFMSDDDRVKCEFTFVCR